MPLHTRSILVAIAALVASGCASPSGSNVPTSRPAPTPEEVRQWDRQVANEKQVRHALESGKIYAGQPIADFVGSYTPYRIDFADRFAFVEMQFVPNLVGLSLVAVDGKLASANEWGCVASHAFFNTMSEKEKAEASAAQRVRLYGNRE